MKRGKMMQNTFSLDVQLTEKARIITVKGKITEKNISEVREALRVLQKEYDYKNSNEINSLSLQKVYDIIVDLKDVSYLDSSMLGALVDALHKHEEHGATVYIGGVNEEVRAILELLQLHKIIMIFPDSRIALAYVEGEIHQFAMSD